MAGCHDGHACGLELSSTVGAPPSVSPFDATRLGWMPMWALASSPAYAAGDQAHEADGVTDAERLRERDEGAAIRAFAEEPSSLGPRCGRLRELLDRGRRPSRRSVPPERTRPAAWCEGSRRRRRDPDDPDLGGRAAGGGEPLRHRRPLAREQRSFAEQPPVPPAQSKTVARKRQVEAVERRDERKPQRADGLQREASRGPWCSCSRTRLGSFDLVLVGRDRATDERPERPRAGRGRGGGVSSKTGSNGSARG